jgi:type II secretory pathway pseudopilin PulG
VALAILGIALTLVLELFAGGLRLLGRSEESLRAAQLAAQKMEEVVMRQETVASERVEQGVFPDGTRWLIRVAPIPSPEATNLSAALPWDLQEYTIRVTWSSGLQERSYDLYTAKLVQKGQQLK